MLKYYYITKYCCHTCGVQVNDAMRLMAKGTVSFVEINNYLIANKSSNVK